MHLIHQPSMAGAGRQRGFVTLFVSLMLLFLITLVTMYAANTAVVEQQVSANQYRSEQALTAADAGMDWGLAYFDSTDGVDRNNDDTVDCTSANHCTGATANAPLYGDNNSIFGIAGAPRVEVFFCASGDANGNTIPDVYEINSVDDTCPVPATTAGEVGIVSIGYSDDGSAVRIIKQLIQTMIFMGEGPKSPVSSISMVDLTGSLRITNRYYNTTIWSGKAVVAWGNAESYIRNPDYYLENADLDGDGHADDRAKLIDSSYGNDWTVLGSGKDWQETNLDVVDGDVNLNALADDPDALFSMFFNGQSKSAFKEAADSLGQAYTAAEFNALTSAEKNALTGYVQIDGTGINLADVGSVNGSALVVVNGSVSVNGGSFYGLIYVSDPDPATTGDGDGEWSGAGNHQTFGALVAEGTISSSGTVDIIYDPEAFDSADLPVAGARVSGTWKDW